MMHKYTNGNYKVTIYDNGTKVRATNDNEFSPAFPESMDLKITNWCDLDCPFCHEQSNTDGIHGDLNKVLDNLQGLPAGVEIACLEKDTKVFTPDGFKCISEINVGDLVLDEKGMPQTVINKVTSQKPCIEVRANKGFIVTCTRDHVFETDSGPKMAKDLLGCKFKIASHGKFDNIVDTIDLADYINPNSRIPGVHGGNIGGSIVDTNKVKLHQSAIPVNRYIKLDDDIFTFYGLVVAEGSGRGISLHRDEIGLAAKTITVYCKKTGITRSSVYPNKHSKGITVELIQPQVYRSIFFNHMKVGKGARNKSIEFLFGRRKNEIMHALYGMFLGDGCFRIKKSKNHTSFLLSYKTSSEKLAYQLNYILYTVFGIKSCVYYGINKKRKIGNRTLQPSDYYLIEVNGKQNIDKLFPFVFENNKEYQKIGLSKYSKSFTYDLKVQSITEVGIKDVVDITLQNESSHLFTLSHGVVTHNCGGGNTLSHPNIEPFLKELKSRGLIANVTMNARHLISLGKTSYERMLRRFIDQGLVKGVGVSWDGVTHFKYEHAVCHVIAGVHPFSSIKRALDLYGKIIILGYKQFGRGTGFYNKAVQDNIDHLRDNLWQILGRGDVVSFDNLSLKQLDVKSHLTDAAWDTFYMGNDGCFTMYYDAVKEKYAKSSISERANVDCGVINYFQRINHAN